MRLVLRMLGAAAALALLLLGIGIALALAPVIRDPSAHFLERKGTIASAQVTGSWTLGDTLLEEVTVTSSTGLAVDFSVRIPPEARAGPRPLVVILAGQGTGRDAARYSADSRGVVVAALSYPYRRRDLPRGVHLLAEVPAMQRAVLDTAPAVLLATDWLLEQPYVDPERVELAGGSFGSFLAPVPAALEPRFRRLWLVHGGADAQRVIEHGLRPHIGFGPARRAAAWFVFTIAGGQHLAPEKWVGRIAPRPVICINALDDESIPRESAEALHRALGEPHEVIWMPGGHVLPKRGETIRQLTELVFTRVAADAAD
jgi:dienelactone hydrolase